MPNVANRGERQSTAKADRPNHLSPRNRPSKQEREHEAWELGRMANGAAIVILGTCSSWFVRATSSLP